jgi:5,10-methylenetetrahydrofolate reductase
LKEHNETSRMNLKEKLLTPAVPVTLFEIVPPALGKPEALGATLKEVEKVRHLVDAINIPEIYDEARGTERTAQFVPRVEPRVLGERLQRELAAEVVINRVTVHDADPQPWFKETCRQFGIQHMVLVGGESPEIRYPGPDPSQAAELVRSLDLPLALGGITIPSRPNESDRIRSKHAAGMAFFTSQILFDSNDIVWLVQRLNGLEARIFLSFAPVSHPRDLEFLRWLGADIPPDLDRFLLGAEPGSTGGKETCFERSLNLAQRILMDVFDNLPPDPPLLGLNVEHINRRNFASAVRMLERLGSLYTNLVASRARSSLA